MLSKQYNYITQQEYQGLNQVNLQREKLLKFYKSDAWLTFLQAKKEGFKIKQGSKGVSIISPFIKSQKEVLKDGEKKKVEYHIPKHYTVFNLDQCESLNKKV